jgi:hypothetical protein
VSLVQKAARCETGEGGVNGRLSPGACDARTKRDDDNEDHHYRAKIVNRKVISSQDTDVAGIKRTNLYRHFDAEGALLYVGVSLSALTRLGRHRKYSHWFEKIKRVEIERFPSRAEALIAERLATWREKPLHNIYLTRATFGQQTDAPPGRVAFSIAEFCRRNGLSLNTYHKLKHAGLGPREMRLSKKMIRIPLSSERQWRESLPIARKAGAR